jgi:hypothetical protein
MALSGILFLSQTKIVLLRNHIGRVMLTNMATYTHTLYPFSYFTVWYREEPWYVVRMAQ